MKSLYLFSPCLVVCFALYPAMRLTAPQYDDTLNVILLEQFGPESLYVGHLDRPIYGWIQRELAARGVLYPACIAATIGGWFAFGITAILVSRRLFPGSPAVAVAASLLTTAPVLVETQFVPLNMITWGQALAHLAYAIHLRATPGRRTWMALTAVSFVLVTASTAVLEYGVSAACAGAVLLTLSTSPASTISDAIVRRRNRLTAVVLLAGAFVGYALHAMLKDSTFRPGANASGLFSDGLFRLAKLPFRLITALYQSSFGGLFRECADIEISDYETITAVSAGIALAGFALFCLRRLRNQRNDDVSAHFAPSLVVALIAMIAGLMPFLMMGRVPNDISYSSRFLMPILPFSACLTAAVLLRPASWRPAVFAALAFTCGFALVNKTCVYRSEVRELAAWGELVRPLLVDDGTTIAVVPCGPGPRSYRFADDVLTATLSRDWSPAERRKFWAVPTLERLQPSPSSAMRGARVAEPVRQVLLLVARGAGDQIDVVRIDPTEIPAALAAESQP